MNSKQKAIVRRFQELQAEAKEHGLDSLYFISDDGITITEERSSSMNDGVMAVLHQKIKDDEPRSSFPEDRFCGVLCIGGHKRYFGARLKIESYNAEEVRIKLTECVYHLTKAFSPHDNRNRIATG